jgi:serine/threonine protein kinase
MEFLEGESLDFIIFSRRQLSLLEKINSIIEACDGLSHAHQRGILHRNIKPANFMIAKEGPVKIMDFCMPYIAATHTGQLFGSITYMAPEQITGRPAADARADIFCLGCILYQFITYCLLTVSSPWTPLSSQVRTRNPALSAPETWPVWRHRPQQGPDTFWRLWHLDSVALPALWPCVSS